MFRLKLLQKWAIFSHLKFWVAVARHNFKWVKFIFYCSALRVYGTLYLTREKEAFNKSYQLLEKNSCRPVMCDIVYVYMASTLRVNA